jgi:hypothetical protein
LLHHYLAFAVVLDKLDDVGVVKLLKQRNLIQKNLFEDVQADLFHVMPFYNFYCIEII